MAKKNDIRLPGMKCTGGPRSRKRKKGNAPARTSKKGNGSRIR
jgi:hypothetical protein